MQKITFPSSKTFLKTIVSPLISFRIFDLENYNFFLENHGIYFEKVYGKSLLRAVDLRTTKEQSSIQGSVIVEFDIFSCNIPKLS